MRPLVRALFCAFVISIGNHSICGDTAADEFPYSAYVVGSSALVRSGPGLDFYATEALDWATKVIVYRHDNKDWAAIRPPASSFSWIPTSDIKMTDTPDLGVVIKETKTLIGSRLKPQAAEVEYVTLRSGDTVEILGQALLDISGDGEQPCYKIMPPAGEFRWIPLSALDREPPSQAPKSADKEADQPAVDELASAIATNESDDIDTVPIERAQFAEPASDETDEPAAAPAFDLLTPPEIPAAANAAPGNSTDKLPTAAPVPTEPVAQAPATLFNGAQRRLAESPTGVDPRPLPSGPPASWSTREEEAAAMAPAPAVAAGQTVPPAAAPPMATAQRQLALGPVGKLRLGQELIDIELQLTQQIALSPENWNLSGLDSRARAVIDTSDDAHQRNSAQRIIAKIAQLEDVKRRHLSLVGRAGAPAATAKAASPAAPAAATATAAADPSYDGVGWLMPVVTEHPDIPRYVLTDEDGNIKQFISPKPGLNLSRFEQQRIGIFGQRGFLPTFNQPHLMAERIISLDKVQR